MAVLTMARAAFLAGCAVGLSGHAYAQAEVVSYKGMCDASAAVALDADHFVVANDERNKLRIYKRGQAAPEGPGVDLSKFLGTKPDKESDLEGAAAVGTRIYWISSHGRNKSGEVQERRHRFFATDIKPGQPPSVAVVGTRPYTNLLKDMLEIDALKARLSAAEPLAPEAPGGLNIEGLAATPEGKLLIAFRNPLPKDRALIVPLENPSDLIEGKKARFGTPIELGGLQKRGIRSIERIGDAYLVVAGPTADDGTFALYRWSGNADDDANPVDADLKGLRPEALFAVSHGVQILSDDGGVRLAGRTARIGRNPSNRSAPSS